MDCCNRFTGRYLQLFLVLEERFKQITHQVKSANAGLHVQKVSVCLSSSLSVPCSKVDRVAVLLVSPPECTRGNPLYLFSDSSAVRSTHILAYEGDSEVRWHTGGYSEYEADWRQRTGKKDPSRVKFRKLDLATMG